jgi:hypothetical protein
LSYHQQEDYYQEVEFYSIGSLMRVPPTLDILGISKRLISERLSENKFRITFSSKYSQDNNKYNKYPSVFFTPCKRWKITMIKKCFLYCGVCYHQQTADSDKKLNGVTINSHENVFLYGNKKYGNLSCVINGEFYEDIPVKIRNYVPSIQIQDFGNVFEIEALE